MLTIKKITVPGFETILEGKDPDRGLHCYIALHNTNLGPALGGVRIHPYESPQEALQDVLRLAKAMTYKSALAENGLGGGKSVIIADPAKDKAPALMHAFAEVVDSLKGKYIAAEDIGTTTTDMAMVYQYTPYVCALSNEKSSGDPSRFTAWGVYRGMQAVAQALWQSTSLKDKTIAIQGLGKVGSRLANILFWEGADLILCDIDSELTRQQAYDFGARIVSPEDFYKTECDILAPCAMGACINKNTIPTFNCKAIAGAANAQLESVEGGKELMKRGILYAPDYIINSGGILNAAAEFEEGGYHPKFVLKKVNRLFDILLKIFEASKKEGRPTNAIADEIAEYNLKHGVGKRSIPIVFGG